MRDTKKSFMYVCMYVCVDDKSPLKGAWSGSRDPFLGPPMISLEYLKLELSDFVQILYAGKIYQVLSLG